MIVLGAILVIIGAGFAAAAVVGGWGTTPHPVNFGVATVSDWSSAAVFLAGMGAMLVLALGLWLVLGAGRRRARGWREDRRTRRELKRSGAAPTTTTADAGALPPPPPPIDAPYDADGVAGSARSERHSLD